MSGRRTMTTMCPMNCHPTYCGMQVEVEGERLVAIKGDPANPDSKGFLCMRGRAVHEIVGNPRRLLHPLRRVGRRGEGEGQWKPVSWEEALSLITGAISQTSRERVGIWAGHGSGVTGVTRPLMMRLGYLGGFQVWNPAIVCWALGAYGLALTGVLEAHTKEDMAANASTIILWGANLASQPTTAPHLVEARKRGAKVVLIDCRKTETAGQADEVLLIKPTTDAALALAMAHVIVTESLTAPDFIRDYTVGYKEFAERLQQFTPQWAEAITGLPAYKIVELARLYGTQTPAMIVMGGSSMFKHRQGWEASRAIACLAGLTGQLGIAGGGFGPRHRSFTRADSFANLQARESRPPGHYIPSHMPSMLKALVDGKLDVLFLLGTNMLSSFSEAGQLEQGLDKVNLVVACDIFMNETIRRQADLVLPGTIWLEEIGIKDTASHIYLMDQALPRAGEALSIPEILRELARRLKLEGYYPWQDHEAYLNALLQPQHDEDGQTLTVAKLRELGGYWQKSGLSHIAYPDRKFHTPSGKIEFYSERAAQVGLDPLPGYTSPAVEGVKTLEYPLTFRQGRSLTAFHSFYDEGQALPSLAKANPFPQVWLHPVEAESRGIETGQAVLIYNERGKMEAVARVTEDVLPGMVWMRDGWVGINRLTSGRAALSTLASELTEWLGLPGGQASYEAQVEIVAIKRN
ncbi:MAG TPA: molybdopterin-dependent oxidoreductase [Chloroflexia bacterium]|nr:molybdopterin-dependent oxidoreductase [Chloroflexia bacterium]